MQHLALVSLCIVTAGLIFLVRKWPLGSRYTFSQHAASNSQATIYYALLFGFALPPLLINLVWWVRPTYDLPLLFAICVIVSIALQHIVTFVPETGGRKTFWHRMLAGISAVLALPVVGLLYRSEQVTGLTKVCVGAGLLVMIGVILWVLLTKSNPAKQNALALQALYYGAFYVAILAVVYG